MKIIDKVGYKKISKDIKKNIIGTYSKFPRKIRKQLKILLIEYLLNLENIQYVKNHRSHFYGDYYANLKKWYLKICYK